MPDFFFNHFDLAAAADLPVPEGSDAVPIWTDVVLRLTKAPLGRGGLPCTESPAGVAQ